MAEVRFNGRIWTWANNRVGEGFVEERLDQFFASPEWQITFPHTVVTHELTQASDNSLLILEDKPLCQQYKKCFFFDKRFFDLLDFEMAVDQAWNSDQ